MARHSFRLDEPGSPEIVVVSDLLRGPRVWVDGQPARRGRERGYPFWAIPMADGSTRRLVLSRPIIGLTGAVDGKIIPLERRLTIWELVLALLPLGMIAFGLLGGIAGAIGAGVNLAVFRQPWTAPVRLLASLGVLAASAVVFAAAIAFLDLIG